MDLYQYLSVGNVLALHEAIMRDTGQVPAVLRDVGLLESAVMRPQMAARFEDADLVTQAAYLNRRYCPGPSLCRW
jgi:prophage maintenance system killer protein